ncbi:GerAB/ArcD/ProY family transporter [Salicibibacter cibarius]|uniref:GerAB/ArcD/ProY family transporter n=1 Tax=Salicibibacter cibarius TaxID=2743000 RepID=A0A7T6Z0V9_9BACI|nr:GerAB/ArcD/ProY family transporter [Salicibibacter cibarius]QQK74905.1 GerAB/ArcD/ProY family transporter [Salicibibacter cibarius]
MHEQTMKTRQISPFLTFFIVTVMQVGVGVFTFQRLLVDIAGHDGWIAIIFSAVMVHIVIGLAYHMLREDETIIDVQKRIFGRIFGSFLGLYWIFYYSLFVLVILVSYVEILRVWLFPEVYSGVLFFITLFLVYLFVGGGLRMITGMSVLSVVLAIPFLFFSRFPYGQLQLGSLFPIWDHSIMDIAMAGQTMTFQFLGFEILFMAYPFIKEAPRSQKWAHFSVIISTMVYLFIFILPVLYFHEHHISTILWPTLSLWRMEYIGVSIWFMILVPNLALGLWAASRAVKQTIKISQRRSLQGLTLFVFAAAFFFVTRWEVEALSSFTGNLGFYSVFVYLPLLYVIEMIVTKWRERR